VNLSLSSGSDARRREGDFEEVHLELRRGEEGPADSLSSHTGTGRALKEGSAAGAVLIEMLEH
jgi:hypothetical protein